MSWSSREESTDTFASRAFSISYRQDPFQLIATSNNASENGCFRVCEGLILF